MNNQSRFAPLVNVLANPSGVDTLHVVLRGTFTLAPLPELGAAQPPPLAADVYWGDPGTSSLRYASDIHVGKVGTDVALVGAAHAPGGRAVPEMLAALAVAGRRKVVRVVGDRSWRGVVGRATPAEPFLTMPLVYERAFGGREDRGRASVARGEGGALAEERNPVGTAFRGRRSMPGSAGGVRLPNLEDPRRPWRAPGDRPPPSAFGFIAPSWHPRCTYAGTYDDLWRRTRAPFLPADFDPRFSNAASPDLVFDQGLRGGEPLALDGVSGDGPQRTSIPTTWPCVEVVVQRRRETPPVRLETVLVEPEAGRLSLTWRAVLRCDKRALKIESIQIREERAPCPARSS